MKSTAADTNLDMLRSIAVLSVFCSHLTYSIGNPKGLPLGMDVGLIGRAGVLIFFVHTSLVLMMSMERMGVRGGRLFLQFYIRRVFRIYPLSILLCIVVSLCAIPPGVLGSRFRWSGRLFLDNVLLVQNVTHSGLLSNPLWSLPFEIQMYAVLPLLFILLRKRHWPAAFAVVLSAACFMGRRLEFAQFAPCFLMGTLAFKIRPLVRRSPLAWWLWPCAVLVLLVCYGLFHPSSNELKKEWALCAGIAALVPLFQECRSVLATAAAKLIARYSYGIYLCHLPLMWVFYRELVGKASPVIRHAGFAAAIAILPILCYHFLEQPLIRVGLRLSQRFSDREVARDFAQAAGAR